MTQLARYRTVLTYSGERICAMATNRNERDLKMSFSKDWRNAKAQTLPLGFIQQEEQAAMVIFRTLDNAKINVDQRLCLNSGGMKL